MKPFFKWVGGKSQLLPLIRERLPESFSDYYEPFLGGGAVCLDLEPERVFLNDCNFVLIHTWAAVCHQASELIRQVQKLDDGLSSAADPSKYYRAMRDRFNSLLSGSPDISDFVLNLECPALFLFLNKHCFNGLYRVNQKGAFNVPYNHSLRPSVCPEHLQEVSDFLNRSDVHFSCGDFESACAGAKAGDFVFFDSPYAPLNPTSFSSYTADGFSVEDHARLSRLFDYLSDRGVSCMLTNHDTELIHKLYDKKGYHMETVPVHRFVNSDGANRKGEEILIWNY